MDSENQKAVPDRFAESVDKVIERSLRYAETALETTAPLDPERVRLAEKGLELLSYRAQTITADRMIDQMSNRSPTPLFASGEVGEMAREMVKAVTEAKSIPGDKGEKETIEADPID